jgi:isopenicillin-N N-acyltransferase-like protein
MAFPIITTAGSPYEVGFQHGQQAADQARAAYRRFCQHNVGDPAERDRLARMLEATVARRRPEALAEMRGIADGAGMGFEQILELNFSIELWSETFLAPPVRGCTLVGARQAGGGLLIGKTMDVTPGDDQYLLVQRLSPAQGHAFVHVTYAGTLWTDGGVNAAGLAQVNSALETNARNLEGYPVFLMTRDLLQHGNSVEAAAATALASDAVNYGTNILLADSAGDMAVVERSVTRQALRRDQAPGDGLFATNHSTQPEMAPVLGGSADLLANSAERFERLSGPARPLPATLDDFEQLFRDHTRPGGFCQHGQGGLHTIGSFIVSPESRQLWVARGAPCQNEFEAVGL